MSATNCTARRPPSCSRLKGETLRHPRRRLIVEVLCAPGAAGPGKETGGRFAKINRPTAGPTHEKDLPVGRHPLQLYPLATPNGVKVTVMLEELLALGHAGAEYDWLTRIDGEQRPHGQPRQR
jgi:hypothetical protein